MSTCFFFYHKPSFWFFWLEDVNVLLHSRLYIFPMQMWCTFALSADQKIESDGVQDLLVLCTARQHHQRTQHLLHFLTTKCPHQPTWNLLFFLNVPETAVGSSVWIPLKYWVAAFTQKVCLMTDDRVLFLNGIRFRVDLLLNGKPKHCMIHYI